MASPQIQAPLEELLDQTRRNQLLLEQIAQILGTLDNAMVEVWNQPAAPVDQFSHDDPGITAEVAQFVAHDKMVHAIKAYRQSTGAGLVEAKKAVEAYRDQLR